MLNLLRSGDVTISHIPSQPPVPCQQLTQIPATGRSRHGGRRKRGRQRLAQTRDEIREQHMASQPPAGVGEGRFGGELDVIGVLKEAKQFGGGGLLLDVGIVLVAGQKRQGHILGIGTAEDQSDDTGRDPRDFVRQLVEVGKRELAILHLLLDLGGGLVADDGTECVAGDHGEASVPIRRLLAGSHDDASSFQLNQGAVSLRLRHGHVDNQTRRLRVVEQMVDLAPQLEEAVGVASDGRVGEGQSCQRLRVGAIGVVPDDEAPVVELVWRSIGTGNRLRQPSANAHSQLELRSWSPRFSRSFPPKGGTPTDHPTVDNPAGVCVYRAAVSRHVLLEILQMLVVLRQDGQHSLATTKKRAWGLSRRNDQLRHWPVVLGNHKLVAGL